MSDYEVIDQITVSLAREIKDKEKCYTGIAIPTAVVAIQLARMSHAPALEFLYGGYWISPDLDIDLFAIMTDLDAFNAAYSRAEGFSKLNSLYNYWEGPKLTLDFGIIRPAQLDQWGNINNSVIGDYNHPKVRFPGGAAVGDIINTCHRVLAYIPRHDTRTIVEKVDFVTGRGASPQWRKEVGLDLYQGLATIITDLCIFNINPNGRLQVKSIHEYSSFDEVQENTGFQLETTKDIPITPPPSKTELELLRTKVDPLEVRKFDSRDR